jgi:PAS domain S-box-containing protein
MLFLCAVLVTSWVGGLGPGLLASALAALALTFFFLPPIYSLMIAEARDLLRLCVFVVAALTANAFAPRTRPRPRPTTLTGEDQASLLNNVRRARSELTALVACLEDRAVFRLDERGRIEQWGVGAERLTGFRGEDVFGRHLSCLYPAEGLPAGTAATDLQTAATDVGVRGKRWFVRGDGSRLQVELAITALRGPYDRQPCRFLVVAWPIAADSPT